MLNEKLQGHLLFPGDIIASRVMDSFSQYFVTDPGTFQKFPMSTGRLFEPVGREFWTADE